MCAGCTRVVGHDRWSPLLSSTRARWQVAGALNLALRESGHRARVVAVAGAWTVTAATGGCVVTDTASGLWAAVRTAGEVDPAVMERLRATGCSAEAAALAEAGAATS